MFFANQILETAVQDSARLILTGQAKNGNYSQGSFKTDICNRIPAILDCTNGVYVDVQKYSSFNAVQINSQIDANKNFVNNMQYNIGVAGDIVVVRAFYQWPLFVTGLGWNVSNLSGSKRLLTATAAFRNEPF